MVMQHETGAQPNLFDWRLTGSLPGLIGHAGSHAILIEEFTENGSHVIRAELPGLDPQKNVILQVDRRVLHIHAERREPHRELGRSEFVYGAFYRAVQLPEGAAENAIKAHYEAGILQITVPVDRTRHSARTIPVKAQTQ